MGWFSFKQTWPTRQRLGARGGLTDGWGSPETTLYTLEPWVRTMTSPIAEGCFWESAAQVGCVGFHKRTEHLGSCLQLGWEAHWDLGDISFPLFSFLPRGPSWSYYLAPLGWDNGNRSLWRHWSIRQLCATDGSHREVILSPRAESSPCLTMPRASTPSSHCGSLLGKLTSMLVNMKFSTEQNLPIGHKTPFYCFLLILTKGRISGDKVPLMGAYFSAWEAWLPGP